MSLISHLTRSIRTRAAVFGAVVVLGACGLGLYLAASREPSYQGKSLSVWIAPFCQETTNGFFTPAVPQYFEELQPVRHAVSAMGSNALPFLMARLNHRESSLHRIVRDVTSKHPLLPFRLADPRVERIRAIRGLAILGPLAQSAVPGLVPALSDPALSPHAAYALATMGKDGLGALANGLTNQSAAVRLQVAAAVMTFVLAAAGNRGAEGIPTNVIPTSSIVELFTRMIQSPTPGGFRLSAIQRLGLLGPVASNAVPVLLSIVDEQSPGERQTTIRPLAPMERQAAIHALAHIQARLDLVIPVLTNHLSDPDWGTRMAAFAALQQLGYPAELHVPPPPRREMHP